MKNKLTLSQVIKLAASGDARCREHLVRATTPKIRTYIHRSTLDTNITNDILQEVYCKMLESLGTLNSASSFWPWLYRIASNCINSYYRKRSKNSRLVNLQDGLLESVVADDNSVEARLMSKELGRAVMEAVATLKPRHRQIVNLRCFEDMSFRDISQIQQTTEVYARVLFHRALEKLRIALKKQGFQKASLILALTMFGRLTATSKAAAIATSVKAASVTGAGAAKVALAAKVVKTVSTVSVHQAKVAIAAAATATVVTTVATIGPLRPNVTSAHYVIQGVTPVVEQVTNTTQTKKRISSSSSSSFSSSIISDRTRVKYQTKGAYENKLYMPQGSEGPVMRFMQRWNTEQTGKLCSWLQDGSGNYYYHSGEGKTYITNDPLRMLILPTDPPELVKFIYSQVGYDSRFSYERKFLTGLLKYSVDNRVPEYPDYKCKYAYNSLEHSDLSSTWNPSDAIEDMRDQMHKRGWTFFEVSGYINDADVAGFGRIPFVYDMYQDHLPWISLNIGNDKYTDYPGNIAMAETEEGTFLYENEAFFANFCRPWEGIPCIDSVRRDAAKHRLRFTTEDMGELVIVTVHTNVGGSPIAIVYDIDRNVDVISSIQFVKGKEVIGELYFDYVQDISDVDAKMFSDPQTGVVTGSGGQPDDLWLSMLVM